MKKFVISLASVAVMTCSASAYANTLPKGVYSGDFGDGKATLFIDSVRNGTVKGTSLYKHNKRPISGTIRENGNFWQITLKEPGTRTGDGKFDITANKYKPSVLMGTWQVFPKNNTKSGIANKSFNLTKASCDTKNYKGYFSNSSTHLLTDEELFTDPESLDYMRNEIYARHGYSFKSKQWATVFAEQDWYVPCYTNVDSKLTTIEKKNIKNIKQMREYMIANPQQWGR